MAKEEHAAVKEQTAPAAAASPFGSLFLEPVSPTSVLFQAPDLSTVVRPAAPAVEEPEEEETDDGDDSSSRRRRRSRGRRGRSRVGDKADEDIEGGSAEADAEDEADEDSATQAEDGVTSRRRRRRRRGDQDLELTGGEGDDPPNTVTRVRAPRAVSEAPVNNRVTSVKGSTRLEAKKQRRRESRDTGRRRTVITEAEFLARRESVDRQMIVRQRDDRIQIAVLEDGVLAEHFVSKTQQDSLIGNVYLGKVQNVLPSMEAAFVDIGRGRNAVLYAGEVNWEAVNLEGKQRRIENALKSGDTVLVQVTKDPVGHKGARLTSQISLPGRYLVYVPGGSMTGISRKLPDVERNRLKRILKDRLPEHAGVIVRTAAEGASEEELTHDINRLRAQWEGIESQSQSTKILAPELLYGEPDLTIKVVRDVFNEDFSKLIVSGEEAWDTIEAYVTYVAPDLVGRLEKWTKDQDIFSAWRIDEQIHKGLFEPLADSADHRLVAQHADLDGVDADVVTDRVQLLGQEAGRRDVDGLHAPGVLRRECRDRGHAVSAMGGNAFEVRLDPGPAGRVGACNGEDARDIAAPRQRGGHAGRCGQGNGEGRRQQTSLRRY